LNWEIRKGVLVMKTLVIHPRDDSTTFLDKVYQDLDGVTLVQGGVKKAHIIDMIDSHDRVMMMGHGTPDGLWSVGQFPDAPGYVIDASLAPALAKKSNSVFIWCNADRYVTANGLKGFYTGMFISEVLEAELMGLLDTTQMQVDESNDRFVETVGKAAHRGPNRMHAAAKHGYGKLARCNPVAKYNHERLYIC
jgi:hypothetical protein